MTQVFIVVECQLDYRFGWRWLLPFLKNGRLYTSGWQEGETRFLQRALTIYGVAQEGADADIWVVNADTIGAAVHSEDLLRDGVRSVCVVGAGKNVSEWRSVLKKGFEVVQEYGLVPSSSPRVVVPLGVPGVAEKALSIHRPGRLLGRAAVLSVKLCARLGLWRPLRRKTLLIATRNAKWQPISAAALSSPAPDVRGNYALYLGTPEVNRKTVVLALGEGCPSGISKLAETSEAREAVLNEGTSLRELGSSLVSANIPSVHSLIVNELATSLTQEYRPRQRVVGSVFEEHVVEFLGALSLINRGSRQLEKWIVEWPDVIQKLPEDIAREIVPAIRWLTRKAKQGVHLWEHRIHGDFAPWNCSWTSKGLFVFDWEASRCAGTAFSDAFRYVVAKELLLTRKPNPKRASSNALNFAQRVREKTEWSHVDLDCQFAVWAMESLGGYRPEFYVEMLNTLHD